jgi:dipeptidyl aminopeptidase/acylaminoacyl peptidase
MKKILLVLLFIILVLLVPFFFKEKNNRFVVGPELNELTFSDVEFINQYDGIRLNGMLFLPHNLESFPIAVIIQGSGFSSRDNPWYLTIAKYLQDNGIGVLLPNKRGSEKSEGNWIGTKLETLATDTESAIHFIMNDSQLNYTEIGIIGMSQGGWIAPIVASNRQDLSFVINMSGAMVSSDEQLIFEEYFNLAPYTYNFIAKWISSITSENLKKRESIAPLMGFDPLPYWKKVKSPVFIAYGENDTNCPVKESIKRLNEENLNHFLSRVYPDGGHGILDIHTNEVDIDFLKDMVRFISSKTLK